MIIWVHQNSSSNSSISYTTDQNIWKVWGGDCNRVPDNDHDLHKHTEPERSNSRIFSQPWKNGGREQEDCNAQHTHCKHSCTAHAAHMTHHLYAYNGCNNLLQKNYQTIWPSNAVRGVNIMPWQMQKGQEGNIGLQFWNRREWTIPAEGHPQAGWQAHHENNESNSEDILKKTAESTTDLHRTKLSTTNSHTNPKNMDHIETDAFAHDRFRQDKNWYSSHLVAMRDEVHLQQIRDTLLVI